jgi:hypothetical protein
MAAPVLAFPSGSLYEIHDHIAALFDTLDGADSPELRAEIESEINRYLEAEIRKVDGVASYLAHCEAQAGFAAQEIKRLQERKALWEQRFERVKQAAIAAMEECGAKKLEGRSSTLSLRACPPAVEILDEDLVPAEYKTSKTVVSIDKKALKATLEANAEIPGADLTYRNTLVRK